MIRFPLRIAVGLHFGCGVLLLPLGSFGQQTGGAASTTTHAAGTDAADMAPSPDHIERWIGELNDDTYSIRQSAADELQAAGMAARGRLLAVVDSPDPEMRAAARRLVALIDQNEFHRQLEAFAADTDGRRGLTLPGWEEFRSLVGGDSAARALFVDMQQQEGPLLAEAFGISNQRAVQLWEDRLMRLLQWPATAGERGATPPLGSCATVLFLGTSSEMRISDSGAMRMESLIQRPPVREAVAAAAGPQDALRRLVSEWVLNCPNKSELVLGRRLNLASSIDLQEVLPLAIDIASGDPQYASIQPATRALAVLLVGQFGAREHFRHLETLLEDATVCMSVQNRLPDQPVASVQIRDVALVVMLHLTGQRPADYGYLHARLQPQRTFQLHTLHRDNDSERAEAIAKWRSGRMSQQRTKATNDGGGAPPSGNGR